MFSQSRKDRRGHRSPQGSQQSRRDRRYHHESDHMVNSVLYGDWSNSVPGRQIPKGCAAH